MKSKYLVLMLCIFIFQQGCQSTTNEIIKMIQPKNPEVSPLPLDEDLEDEDEDEIQKIGTEFGNPNPNPTSPKVDSPPVEQNPDPDQTIGTEFGNPSKSQKGPFYMDSEVSVQEITETFELTGNIYLIRIEDNLGTFNLPRRLTSPYIETSVTGYYFNEVSGEPSDGMISLGSYSSLKDGKAPNTNILTTLAQKRIKYLVEEESMNFEEAEFQAKIEVLRSFHIQDDLKNFDELSIDGDSQGDSALLAISIILQGEFSTVELSNFIARIREDLRENGQIDDNEIYRQICENTIKINPLKIRENLAIYYESLGLNNYRIPLFEDYLDSDCNGTINKNDPESFIFFKRDLEYKTSEHSIMHSRDFIVVSYQDKLWMHHGLGLYVSEDFHTFWTGHRGGEIGSFSYPIPIEWNNKLYFFGGRGCHRPDGPGTERFCFDLKSVFQLDEEENISKLSNMGMRDYRYDRYFRDRDDNFIEDWDFIRAYSNDFVDDNTYPNYSMINHRIKVINNKVYAFNIDNDDYWPFDIEGGLNFNRRLGFYGAHVSDNGIDWYQDPLSGILSRDREIYDIVQFNNEIFILKVYGRNNLSFSKMVPVLNENNEEVLDYQFEGIQTTGLHIRPIDSKIHLIEYHSNIFMSYEKFEDMGISIFFSNDFYNWRELFFDYPSFENYNIIHPHLDSIETIHKPIIFKDMIHLLTEDEVISFGHYQYYKPYLQL